MMHLLRRAAVVAFALGLATIFAVAPASACDGKGKSETQTSSDGK